MMGGYSMSHQTKDAFIKISNVKVKVMSKLKGQVNMFSSCVQKELPPGSRKYYDHIVTDTKEEILKYCDPFFNAPAHHLKADVENDVIWFQIYYPSQRYGMKCLQSLQGENERT